MPLLHEEALNEWFRFINYLHYKTDIPVFGLLSMNILQLAWRYVTTTLPSSAYIPEMVELLDISDTPDKVINQLSDKLDVIRGLMYN